MNEVVEFYQQIAKNKRLSCALLADIQKKGLAYLIKHGLPTRADEDWRYSTPTAFMQERFDVSVSPQDGASHFSGESTAILKNGHLTLSSLPDGITITPLSQVYEHSPELIRQLKKKLFVLENGFHAMNAALLDSSLVIRVAAHTQHTRPLLLSHYQDVDKQAVHTYFIVMIEKGASVSLIEEFTGATDCTYLSNRVMAVFLESKAAMSHRLIQRESQSAYHLSHAFVYQSQDSIYQSHLMNLGGKWVRADQSLHLQGERASCLMNGVYGLANNQHMDSHTAVFHEVPNCQSQQDYKGIVAGTSRAVFNGRVIVAPHAQKSQAIQQNKNLLLCKDAEIYTKPQLEIEANDVTCSHGATIGQVDEEALFYFAARGLSREVAIRFIVEGFSAGNIALFGDKSYQEKLGLQLQQHLTTGAYAQQS